MRDDKNELDLTLYLDVLLRRRWIVVSTASVAFLIAAVAVFTARPVYQATALLVIEKERGGNAIYANGLVVESNNEDYYQTQYKLLKSDSILQEVHNKLDLAKVPEFEDLHDLKEAVAVAPVLRSRLVYVKAESYEPALAARIANALCQTFVEQNLSNQLFISKDILHTLQLQQNSPETRKLYEHLPAVVNNALIQQIKSEYIKLSARAADLSGQYTERHPTMAAFRSQMAALRAQLDEETGKIVQSLKTELSGQLKGNNVRIIDEAKAPGQPVRPRKKLGLALGAFLGLLLGYALAWLVEILDQTVRTQEDVESRLGLPFLGLIPLEAKPRGRGAPAPAAPEDSLTGEAFRNLRTMVDFACAPHQIRVMLVTSAVQEEGKTYVSSNLATVFAQLGERVLLVDGDLRRPKLHHRFGLSVERGLSDFLAGGTSIEEAEGLLRETDVANLKVLPCGARPPNPSELLNTPRVGALLAWAGERFDRVIIDCTPMFPISDTLLWGRHVRAAVCVTRFGGPRATLSRSAFSRLQAGGVKILGAVVNGAKFGGLGYTYGRAYQYYYQEAEPTRV